jgi:hypothetical protein
MKLYIAGKITGLHPSIAADWFEKAGRYLEGLGHEALDPMKLVDQAEGRCYEDYLLEALEIVLCRADALYMLPNWRDSLGARIEHAIAVEKGMPIFYAESLVPECGDVVPEVAGRR